MTRYRKTLVQERPQEVNRLQKVLEGANVKLAAVTTDIMGKSGRNMLAALVGGEQDPEALATARFAKPAVRSGIVPAYATRAIASTL